MQDSTRVLQSLLLSYPTPSTTFTSLIQVLFPCLEETSTIATFYPTASKTSSSSEPKKGTHQYQLHTRLKDGKSIHRPPSFQGTYKSSLATGSHSTIPSDVGETHESHHIQPLCASSSSKLLCSDADTPPPKKSKTGRIFVLIICVNLAQNLPTS